MEALKKKWNSRRGASILLALLFLLVCIMAGASILMAAASDAGKVDSNKKEQQKYLTLSSALTLVCDDLERVEYVGKYDYKKIPVYQNEAGTPLLDADGNPLEEDSLGGDVLKDETTGEPIVHHYKHTYTQYDGIQQKRTDPVPSKNPWGLETDGVLEPLRSNLDHIFANHFDVPENQKNITDDYDCQELNPTSFVTFTLDLTAGVNRDTYGGLADTVRIKVELRADGSIKLTATLMEEVEVGGTTTLQPTDYAMTAVLRPDPDNWPEVRLVLKKDPTPDLDGFCRTDPIRWKLDCFVKGEEAEPSAGP